jgi:putative membrane protein insertion efficiency factor
MNREGQTKTKVSMANRLVLWMLELYRTVSAPFKHIGCCRFTPTCSAYAIEAFKRHRFAVAMWLTVRRLSRCHPFYRGVLHDPVP